MKQSFFLIILCLSLILLTGCGAGNVRSNDELIIETTTTGEYRSKSGDVLLVKVWGEPRLTGEVLVRDDGKFTLPLIDDVVAVGKTLKEISSDVSKRLKEFIPSVTVTTTVVQTAPVRYFLSGQFIKPGEYRSDKRITLLQAVATGGGFAPFADESSIILIRRGTEENGGAELRYELDYNQVVDGKEPNPELKNGDVVAVK